MRDVTYCFELEFWVLLDLKVVAPENERASWYQVQVERQSYSLPHLI